MENNQRTFLPGSEWVYIKVYTGIKTAEMLLTEDIPFIIKKLRINNLINKWFFVRYEDTDFHLRIRILLNNEADCLTVIRLFYNRFNIKIKTRQIWKIQLDTYIRELERYNESLIEETESLFHIDSECILVILKKMKDKDENFRWMIALKMIDDLLSDFSYTIQMKMQLMKNLDNAFKAEFGFTIYNAKQFNVKFRENKSIIESILKNKITNKYLHAFFISIKKKSQNQNPIIKNIQLKMKKNINNKVLLESYIHMMLNRLFVYRNRMHELVIYDFMYRYYKSEVAKEKYNISLCKAKKK
jgi:thiopeptide-type bacteriocin biosynthesis protein